MWRVEEASPGGIDLQVESGRSAYLDDRQAQQACQPLARISDRRVDAMGLRCRAHLNALSRLGRFGRLRLIQRQIGISEATAARSMPSRLGTVGAAVWREESGETK
jgi:hypothetical protein